MKKLLAIVLAAVMAFGVFAFTGCSDKTGKSDFKVGAILIGDENEGYTYAHIQGIEAAKKACNLSDDQIVYKYIVPENEKCYEAAIDLVDQGCKLIIANSFGHESYLIRAAGEHPDVIFCHATGKTAAKHTELTNMFNYFDSIYEARYVSGIVAGMKLKELMDEGKVTDPYIGYVGAYPYAEVVSGYTAFFLGIRSIVPEAHMDVQYTQEWFDIVKESEAANAEALIANGCVIIGQHADSTGAPSAVQAKYEAGETVFSVGYNIDMLSVAPDVALTSPQNNWGAYYTYAFEQVMNGKKPEQDWCHGYSNNAVQISPLGKACAAGTQEAVDAAIEKIKSGELKVFDCSTFTVNGEHLTGYDKSDGFEGTQLIWDGYFHESEVISAPLFDIRIDGITELSK